jgi:hypothetical protein
VRVKMFPSKETQLRWDEERALFMHIRNTLKMSAVEWESLDSKDKVELMLWAAIELKKMHVSVTNILTQIQQEI